MSDNVILGTINNTVTPSDSSGENGLPFPYDKTGTTGPGTTAPVGMNYQEAMKMWHRIKTFLFSSTWSMVVAGTTYTFTSGNMSGATSRNRELDMADAANDLRFDTIGTQACQFQLTTPFVNASNDEFGTIYPTFTFSINLITPAGIGTPFIQFVTQDTGGSIGNFNADFDGLTLTIYYYFPSGTPDSFSAGNMLIEAVEYWPYAGSPTGLHPGAPIYDTSTGVALIPPTS